MKNPAPRNATRCGSRDRSSPNLKFANLKSANLKSEILDIASLLNIAHLHFRFARQASERGSQLGATTIPHAARAGAIDLDVLRHRQPDHDRRGDVAKGGTAHVLFIKVEGFVANEGSRQRSANRPDRYLCQAHLPFLIYPPGRIAVILPAG